MSAAEILQELPKLTAEERAAIRKRLRELEGQDESQFLHDVADSMFQETDKLERIENQVKKLTQAQQETLGDWLENLLEDRLGFTEEFKASIQRGEQDIREGRVRIRKP
jgi:mRNA-degrading endonuclease RelE of RelBE toxin-antitoxin system